MICCAKLVRALCAACELRDLLRFSTQDRHNLCETLCYQHGMRASGQHTFSQEEVYDLIDLFTYLFQKFDDWIRSRLGVTE